VGAEFEGRRVIVTGGSGAIGWAIATAFAGEGALVAVVDLIAPADSAPTISHYTADLTDEADIQEVSSRIINDFGGVDVLVNNAAIWFRRQFSDVSAAEWDRVLAVNLRAPFLMTQQITNSMVQRGSGVVINIASQAGVSYTDGQGAHYHASKAGLIHLTKVLAHELGPKHIRVNAVAPGLTMGPTGLEDTPISDADQAFALALLAKIPLGRYGRREDVTHACLFLASDRSSYITGQTLLINGGVQAYA
jgi:NAD(P)-dependent dehydrogenase (short-subunit alcohol dehydrogenase family)